MENVTIKIEGMSCSHCVNAVTKAVNGLGGVDGVTVSLEAGSAQVKYDAGKVTLDRIKAAIEDEGYDCP
ncbi:MAG: copper ion binding protein [Synergistaceae bacterium]|jgi:copper chaperone|nr:copper ion binding protein [Synergistaceae bacterium]